MSKKRMTILAVLAAAIALSVLVGAAYANRQIAPSTAIKDPQGAGEPISSQQTLEQNAVEAQAAGGIRVIELSGGRKLTVTDTPPSNLPRTWNDLLVEAGTAVPGFGGLSFDPKDESILNVYMLDPSDQAGAEQAAQTVFGVRFAKKVRIVRTVQGQYSMTQLAKWYEPILVMNVPGLVLTGFAGGPNRIEVGVVNEEARGSVLRELDKLGIPTSAVVIEITAPIQFTDHLTLSSYVRPLRGGLRVSSNFGKTCTMSFLTVKQGVLGFTIPTHCSSNLGGVDGDIWYQPTVDANNRVGVETDDQPFFEGGSCPQGRACRYSDSAFVSVDAGVQTDRGYVARTTGIGSTTIDDAKPKFRIKGESGGLGSNDTFDKIAKTTGWRAGKVTDPCYRADIEFEGHSLTFLCQDLTDATQLSGDSGGAVFEITNSPAEGDVVFEALAWGNANSLYAVVSELSWIYFELGPTETWNTCAPEFSC